MKNYELEHLDVNIIFLHGDLEEQIYMQQLEGYKITGKENHVCLLKKSLYGLKQSLIQWYRRFYAFIDSGGSRGLGARPPYFFKNVQKICIISSKIQKFIYLNP
jgi:Reverse transcriptase (RNA-dependent DNA polymerase)